MSLYLSEWLNGPSVFIDFARAAWDPQVNCTLSETEPDHVLAQVSIFNVESVNILIDELGEDLGKRFIARMNMANSIIYEKLGLKQFISENLNDLYQTMNGDLEELNFRMTNLFIGRILDVEFWNNIDFTEVYTNLIFYGMFFDPKPVYFFVPPKSKWDDYPDGWYDYLPGDN